jgi:uncharacterized protein (TIGR02246 family)
MGDDDIDALRERVRRLEDLEAIRQLYVDYGRSLDAGDAAAYASLFARDAELRLGRVMDADGREAIEQAATAVIRTGPKGEKTSVHVLGSPHVELDGDVATGDAVWVAILRSDEGPPTVRVGRHLDDIVREDGHWRFARRRGALDIW